ncbi:MAG TPA: hypothetical protein V6C65_27490 [Allocoleopsis sp.]
MAHCHPNSTDLLQLLTNAAGVLCLVFGTFLGILKVFFTRSPCTTMRWMSKLIGLALLLVGVYFLGQNIIFTTRLALFWWRDISAAGSVIAMVTGILLLFYGGRGIRETGWLLVGLGILLVFVSGGVILRPTSLWTLFLSLISLTGGYQLLTTGRLNF